MLTLGHEALADLASSFPDVEFVRADGAADLRPHLADVEAVVLVGFAYTAEVAAMLANEAPRLRWIQSANAGVDSLFKKGVPSDIPLTHGPTIWGPGVAEHAVALLLGLLRRFPELERNRARHAWDRDAMVRRMESLEGRLVLCLGFGKIGRGVAQRLKPFGSRVVGFATSARADVDAEAIVGLDRLDDYLPEADAVVIALPSSEETRGLISRERLALMKPSALLVNVARGDIVDEAALAECLAQGRLAGASLDAFEREPLPADDPFWDLENVILTPHIAGFGGNAFGRLAELVGENLRRYQAGEPLLYPVKMPDGG